MIDGKVLAIPLRVGDHGESDKIVTFYSSALGRVTGIAKGAKKSKKRFVNKLEEFSLLELQYRLPRGSTLLFISEADLIRSHLSLRQNIGKYTAAMYLSELLLRFTRDNDADPEVFLLLQWAFQSIDTGQNPQKIMALFHLRLLSATGYHPELGHCHGCMHPVGPNRSFVLTPGNGALLCNACHPGQYGSYNALSIQTLKFLASAQQSDINRLNRLQLPEHAAKTALEALYLYTSHLLQQDIHSWSIMRSLSGKQEKGRPS